MNNILLQISKKFIGEVLGVFGLGQIKTIEEMEVRLKQKTDSFILEMMKVYLETLDQAIVEDKANRRNKGIVIERKSDKREMYTQFGSLKFERTYFYDKRNQEYAYLVDQAVGLEGYERISVNVARGLVEHAGESSYGESSRHVSGGEISRQTVMKKVRLLNGLEVSRPETKRSVRVLHVDADEDHVAMQDGTNAIVPLISIHDGIEKRGRRGRCVNIHHISSYGKSTEELWLEAAKWIYDAYEIEAIERIYLHGDGAAWIKEGRNWLPGVQMVLDKYHLNRSIIEATGRQRERRGDIYSALRECDKKRFRAITDQMYENAVSKNEQEKIHDFRRYIQNNWEGIAIYSQEACGGSCAEGHVSHVLSSRLSSRPMGWSRAGLKAMSELRAFCSSGGKVEVKHIKPEKPLSYKLSKRIMAKIAKVFRDHKVDNLDNMPVISKGKVTYMHRRLQQIQNCGYDF